MHSKLLKRLATKDVNLCIEFIKTNDHLSKDDFAIKVNRWYLDEEKPKRYSDMWALVLQSNGG